MALLGLVNRLYNLWREEELSALPSSDVRAESAIGLLNQSKDLILGGRDWRFNHRPDGVVEFPAPITGTTLTLVADSSMATISPQVTPTGVPKMLITATDGSGTATTYPNTAWRVLSFDNSSGGSLTDLTLHTSFPDQVSGTGAWELVFHEAALPATVARVTSIRDEEHPLHLYFEEDELSFDAIEPRPQDERGNPDLAIVDGMVTNVFDASSATSGDSGVRLLVWPVPSQRTLLFYTYIQRQVDLVSATDSWPGVPSEVLTLVVQGAYELSLRSKVEQDVQLSAVFSAGLQRDIRRVHARNRPDPMRRRIPRPFGSRITADPWRRWATRQVPTP